MLAIRHSWTPNSFPCWGHEPKDEGSPSPQSHQGLPSGEADAQRADAIPEEVIDERLQCGPVHRREGSQELPVLANFCLLILQRCQRERMNMEEHKAEIKATPSLLQISLPLSCPNVGMEHPKSMRPENIPDLQSQSMPELKHPRVMGPE